eukprot:comp23587_c0_seq1/m.40007 comp23587_c0_seq1/g.40007  ORF comp23587_c0_seq1/g.40007 comp23587_c0_seq1/m.40007 type:complete len:660 (-) comp23587_c0_seq1:242-2221(-)
MAGKQSVKRQEPTGSADKKIVKKPRTDDATPKKAGGKFGQKPGGSGGKFSGAKNGSAGKPFKGGTGQKGKFAGKDVKFKKDGKPSAKKTSEEGKEQSGEEDGKKKTKKETKKERKMQKPHGEVVATGNRLWNVIRERSTPADKRKESIKELMELVRGRMHDIIMRHDAVRFIQCCVQYGNVDQRTEIFNELKGHIMELMKHTYSKFLVKKMLDYGTKEQREHIMTVMHGQVVKLLKHREAAVVVEAAYNDWATAAQRHALMQEFYGPEFKTFKDKEHGTLAALIAAHPDKKEGYISNLAQNLQGSVNKGTLAHSIIHALLAEFFAHADDTQKQDMVALIAEHIASILHTRDGMKVAQHCIWVADAKGRKGIIKGFKGLVAKICKEEHGHNVLLSLFDVTDDTVLVRKSIINEIISNILEISTDKYGRLVLLYLLVPRSKTYFNPQVVAHLAVGDGNPNSKKPMDVRQGELRDGISKALLEHCTENAASMARDGPQSQLMEETLLHATGDKSAAMGALLKEAEGSESLITHPIGGMMLKRLILKNCMAADDEHIGSALWKIAQGQLEGLLQSKQACYTLAALLVADGVPAELKAEIVSTLQSQNLPAVDATDDNGKLLPQAALAKSVHEYAVAAGLDTAPAKRKAPAPTPKKTPAKKAKK